MLLKQVRYYVNLINRVNILTRSVRNSTEREILRNTENLAWENKLKLDILICPDI